jgi:putative aminopeptidase FrvX
MKTQKKSKKHVVPEFLKDMLAARGPSGFEMEVQAVVDKHLKPAADVYEKDAMGNRIATLKGLSRGPTLMLAGHMDELGLMVTYIDDKGFIYFDTVGGHDVNVISGRRIVILSENGPVWGVTGKRAVHLMTAEERKKAPELHDLWIDIGAKSAAEAFERVRIGDVGVYDHGLMQMENGFIVSRALDDRAGCYAVCETLRRLSAKKEKIIATVVSVATSQEEIGTRGAATAGYKVNPALAVAVDVCHATDHPSCDPKKHGSIKLGAGPVICRGPNINPMLFDKLVASAKALKIPYQIEGDPRPTGTDARAIQMAREGIATALVSIPLRYMHTPSEMMQLDDIEHTVELLVHLSQSIKKGDTGIW